jgi:NAD(P)-dependent dehydrogenase (short-subunit alcohol dehydrogenase family)
VADYIDKQVEKASDLLKDTLSKAPWIPESIRPRPPPPEPPKLITLPSSAYEKVQDWVSRHKILTGIIVLTTGVVVYRTYKSGRYSRKTRRAKRARSGGRLEVVVLAGSPTLPLTRSLSLDLERKGFVVFIVCNTIEDEMMVQNLARPDVRPLTIDITDVSTSSSHPTATSPNTLQPPSAGSSIERFAHYLQDRHSPVPGAKHHHLTLKAVLLIPSLTYQTSPIATIPPSSFADLFNTHLLHPILTIQAFLPLLTARLGSSSTDNKTPPKVLVFTPSIISSINPPFHAPEATVCSALSAFTEVLAAELRPLSIPVTHIQLGTFDFQGFTPDKNQHTQQRGGGNGYQPGLLMAPAETAEPLTWPESARHAYGRNYVNQSASAIAVGRIRGLRGSSLRSLHNAVFDVIDGSNTSGVVRIGLGASVYGFVGRWVPRGLVSWMMGIRRVDELASWSSSSGGNSPRPGSAGSSSGSAGGMDYVSVPVGDLPGGADVWREV